MISGKHLVSGAWWRPAAYLVLFAAVLLSAQRAYREYRTWYDPPDLVNLHVRQAGAFLKGRLDLERPAIDTAQYNGRTYVSFPPGPAVVFVPAVWLFGERLFIAPIVCALLTILNVRTVRHILAALDVHPDLHYWLIAAFFLGSGYWFVLVFSYGIWHSAHVVATTFVLFALSEILRRGNTMRAGVYVGAAFLSRQFTLSMVVFAALLARNTPSPSAPAARLLAWSGMLAPVSLAIAAYVAFNFARFHDPFETGYRFISFTDYELARVRAHGLFSPAYVPVNLFHLLVQGFHIEFTSTDRLAEPAVDWFGTSLPAASPFIFLALLAPLTSPVSRAAWPTILLTALVQSFYFVNGAGQLNWQRYALDYWPVLFLLVAMGFAREHSHGHSLPWKLLIVYAITLNALVLALWSVFGMFLGFCATQFVM
jgi:hypothetical protein